VHAHHPSANITPALVTAVSLCFSSQVIRGQVGVQTQTFMIHGTPRTCSAIWQLDSALSAEYQQFFAGWTEKDYVDALAWSQACSEYGWHVPGRPRIPLLQAQHDRVMGSAQTQIVSSTATAGVSPSPPVRADIPPQPQSASSAATGNVPPSAPVPADIPAQAQTASSTVTGNVPPSPPVQAAVSAPAQAAASTATGSALPSPPVEAAIVAPAQAAASSATGSALPSPPVEAAIAAPAQAAASTATGSALPNPPVQAAVTAPAQAVRSEATGNQLPNPSVQAAVAAPARDVPSTATGSVLPIPAVPVPVQAQSASSTATDNVLTSAPDIPAQPQTVSSTAKGSTLPSPRVRGHTATDGEEDSLLAENFFKEHFHQESLWVATKANLDIGDDRASSSWSSSGIPAQMKNRLTADRIVLYCARKTNGEPGKRPLLWDLRWCEAEEASAYNRLVSGNEFPTAGRGVVLGCAGVDSYVYLERCMQTLTETAKQ
jgi:hypothetical protein